MCRTFFFQGHRAHRNLHSFPTRRSSDLVEAFLRDRLPALHAAGARVVANFWGDSPEEFAGCAARLDGAPGVVRSEEHTSELQSHVNLVCRLLLEKKKARDSSL